MLRDRIILCIASSWNYDPTSKHHLMRILSRNNHVLWVNYHGTRRPTLSRSDIRSGWSALRRFVGGLKREGPTFAHFTPLVIPGARSRRLRAVHARMVVAQVRRALERWLPGYDQPIQLWAFAPDVPFMIGAFNEELLVYYCVDDHGEFEGIDRRQIRNDEEQLVEQADLVVTTSQRLLDAKRVRRPDAVLIRHGVDFDHFASAWRNPPPTPPDLAEIPGPILGFFGLIHFWVDQKLIADVARLRPQYSFVLIGDRAVDVGELARIPNVHLLGRRPNSELPAYCARFSAGLMPFVRSPMTRSVNPIKMYEYLAAGLPVISTPIPEAKRFAGPIRIVDTAEAFANACDDVIAGDHPQRRRIISEVVAEDSWESRVDRLHELIESRPRRLLRSATASKRGLLAPADAMKDPVQDHTLSSPLRSLDRNDVDRASNRGVPVGRD